MWRRSARHRPIVIAVLTAAVVLLAIDLRTNFFDGVSSGFSEVAGIFQSGVRTVVRPIESVVAGVKDFGRLKSENSRLRSQNEVLQKEVAGVRDIARENARFRELLALEESLNVTTVRARVIGASLSGLEKAATVDRGRDGGIEPDSAVLSAEGLVGRVARAGSRTSTVQLLTDPQSSIGVRIDRNGETGIVTGTGRTLLRLGLVDRDELDAGSVRKGDTVVTSGYQGGIFPAGIPLGVVEEVDLAERGTAYRILIRPFVRLSRLDVISVVSAQKRTLEPIGSDA